MFKKSPTLYTMKRVYKMAQENNPSARIDGKWVPARPEGFWSWQHRLSVAWKVFKGEADAFTWPGGQ